jgi:hypothetical protein
MERGLVVARGAGAGLALIAVFRIDPRWYTDWIISEG